MYFLMDLSLLILEQRKLVAFIFAYTLLTNLFKKATSNSSIFFEESKE